MTPPPHISRRRTRLVRRLALAGLGTIALTGCVSNASQSALKPHGSIARLQNSLFVPVFWIAVVVFGLVAGLVSICVVRFRARSDDEAPRQIHGNTRAEIAWTIAPAVLLASIAIPTVKFVFDLNKFPSNAMTITVTGHRWWWQMDYPSPTDPTKVDFSTASELHIPVKQPVIISLTSVDVIHNFWVPELAGKLYAIPGRHNKMVLEADSAGTYYGQCAEFCGTSHANMRLRVIAQSSADYQAWVNAQESFPSQPATATSLAATGFQVFNTVGCAGCHAITGVSAGIVGPNLSHFKSRSVFAGAIFANTDPNLRLWLANPPAQKPGSVMPNLGLSSDQINALVAYLDTLQ